VFDNGIAGCNVFLTIASRGLLCRVADSCWVEDRCVVLLRGEKRRAPFTHRFVEPSTLERSTEKRSCREVYVAHAVICGAISVGEIG
jgi:hypothetical protein